MASNISKIPSNMLSNPNLDAADTGTDPVTGKYLSKNERVAIFRKRKIKTSSVFGRKDPKITTTPRRGRPRKFQTLAEVQADIDARNPTYISPVTGKRLPGTGPKLDSKKFIPQNKILNDLLKQVESNTKKIASLNGFVKSSIDKLSNFLVDDAEKEKKESIEKERDEERELETDKKKKKEGLLEGVKKSMSNALMRPVEAIGNQAKGMLQKLVDVFQLLFVGFLSDKALKMIQAHLSGDTETFKKMRNTIIKSVAIVGGIFLALNGGLLALPGIISGVASAVVTIGGAILGFLASPAGLIALGIAAGIGTLFAMKSAVDAGKVKAAGGQAFYDKFEEMKGPLVDAGITIKGTGKNEKFYVGKSNSRGRGQKTVEKAGSPEQKEIVANYITERDKVITIRDNMREDMEAAESKLRKESGGGRSGTKKLQDSGAIGEAKGEIREKYESMITGEQKSNTKITPVNEKKDVTITPPPKNNTVSTLDDTQPNVIVQSSTSGNNKQKPPQVTSDSTTKVPNILSSNRDNLYLSYSQIQYNMVM